MVLEASKEAMEQRHLALGYVVLYTAPFLGRMVMSHVVYLPHFFPGITLGAALIWICQTDGNTKPRNKRDSSACHSSDHDILRIAEVHAYERNLCRRILYFAQWLLPLFGLVEAMVHTVPNSHTRIVMAYTLSILKTSNLFSPLGWASGSLQILLFALGSCTSGNRHNYEIDFLVTCLAMTTFRFLRVGPSRASNTTSPTISATRAVKGKSN
jgi:hypothetical protein